MEAMLSYLEHANIYYSNYKTQFSTVEFTLILIPWHDHISCVCLYAHLLVTSMLSVDLVSIFTLTLHNQTHLTSTVHFTVRSCAVARVWIEPHERSSHLHVICTSICDWHKNKTNFMQLIMQEISKWQAATTHQFRKSPGWYFVYWSTMNQGKKIFRRERSRHQTDPLWIILVASSFTSDRCVTTLPLGEGGACFMWLWYSLPSILILTH